MQAQKKHASETKIKNPINCGILCSLSEDATDHLLGSTSSSTWSLAEECTLQHYSEILKVFFWLHFSDLYQTKILIKLETGDAQSVSSLCLLLPAQFLIIGLHTVPPVILVPTAAGIIVSFVPSVCVLAQW